MNFNYFYKNNCDEFQMIKNKIWGFNNYGRKERNEIGKILHKKRNKLLCREIKKNYWWFSERTCLQDFNHFKSINPVYTNEAWNKYCVNLEIERIKLICNRFIIRKIHKSKRVRLHKSYKCIWNMRTFKRELKAECLK